MRDAVRADARAGVRWLGFLFAFFLYLALGFLNPAWAQKMRQTSTVSARVENGLMVTVGKTEQPTIQMVSDSENSYVTVTTGDDRGQAYFFASSAQALLALPNKTSEADQTPYYVVISY